MAFWAFECSEMSVLKHLSKLLLASSLFLILAENIEASNSILYRGKVTVDNKPFNGKGHFKFALLLGEDRIFWQSTTTKDSIEPSESMSLPVRNGRYEVYLGEVLAGMPPLPKSTPDLFHSLNLRIWFSAGSEEFRILAPDHSLAGRSIKEKPEPSKDKSDEAPFAGYDFFDKSKYSLGKSDAPLIMVEYSDYQCGHCSLFHEITYKKIVSTYVDTGKMRFIVENFPLRGHTHAQKAAEASYCAGEQGRYWEMRDLLFRHSNQLSKEKIRDLAIQLGLHPVDFNGCLDSGKYAERVEGEKSKGIKIGVKRTPSFILAKVVDGEITGKLIEGGSRWTEIKSEINAFLDEESDTR